MTHKEYLEYNLHKRLGTNDSILHSWENSEYRADEETVNSFWKMISEAPAVAIIGDYDVDGVMSTYNLLSSIREVYPQKRVVVRIPRRFSEGYGINRVIAEELKGKLPQESLVITVDNGISAPAVLKELMDSGYHVIVTDHHALREGNILPEVDMVINPAVKQIKNPMNGDYWCGAGVVYNLCAPVISEKLKETLTVTTGIATVADCMPLKEGNWGIVRRAIKAFRDKKAPSQLCTLLEMMGIDPDFCNEEHFGYYLGPALNAPGRLVDNGATDVVKYLYNPTQELSEMIIQLNNERKELVATQTEAVENYIIENNMENDCPLWVAYPNLHHGVIGIIAGRLAEKYKRPAIVLTTLEENQEIYKGSGRSYGNFDIYKYLSGMSENFSSFGGHPGAAGLSLKKENLEKCRANTVPVPEETSEIRPFQMKIRDYEIPVICETLNKFRPFGEGNMHPEFEMEIDTEKMKASMVGKEKDTLSIFKGRYKIMNFHHIPNTLRNKEQFKMRGRIEESSYKGVMTPQFIGNEVYDLDYDGER